MPVINTSLEALDEIGDSLKSMMAVLGTLTDEIEKSPLNDCYHDEIQNRLEHIKSDIYGALTLIRVISARFNNMCNSVQSYVQGGSNFNNASAGHSVGRPDAAGGGHGDAVRTKLVDGKILVGNVLKDSKVAIINQGSNSMVEGSCGLCASGSALNSLGMEMSEQEMIDLALGHDPPLCQMVPGHPERSGGTSSSDRTALINSIFEARGMSHRCEEMEPTTQNIASSLDRGDRVIISVIGSRYYQNPNLSGNHALYVSGMITTPSGEPTGFVVIDSNGRSPDTCTRILSSDRLRDCLSNRPINVIR